MYVSRLFDFCCRDGFTKPSSIKRGRGLYSQCRAHNFDLEEQAIQSQNRKESTVADEEYCVSKCGSVKELLI